MSLQERIDSDLTKALKGGEKEKATVLRSLKSDIKYRQIDRGHALSDEEVIEVMSASVKKIKDSIDQFSAAGRTDLVEKEQFGLGVISAYLPEQLSQDELVRIIHEAITESGADSPQKMGLVMKLVVPKTKGRADGKLVTQLVNQILAK